ncbi:tRNA modification GTPase trmE [Plectosphaerella plurivora]|uniref:tRNA modification GTPase trmE n=1 Tax=Plectosphaerella plurivora TaxID=936078 RepID=A0A9P9AB37_9PEZI|nr:tRNA modification GTPase trmE [Plectosphaerella plurivora]
MAMGACQHRATTADDTIYALSTAQGRAGIAVIRISGPRCLDVYRGLCPAKAVPRGRHATVRTLLNPHVADGSDVLDSHAIVLYFPGPNTVTGEDVLELHVHGGQATVKAILAAIPRCAGPLPEHDRDAPGVNDGLIRYAEPGEFTRRAFLNDRLDLAQVESLGDTLAADTEQQRRAAVRGNSGALGRTYDGWRSRLLLARGEIEALIDFSEDQHFDESPTELLHNVSTLVRDMLRDIKRHEAASTRTELLRSGIQIALVGPPNAGKSSLMNLVVGREASIVSTEAGTTRDIVEVSLDIRGYLCSFADTAGFRSRTSSPLAADGGPGGEIHIGMVEEEGIRRAKQKALDSDIVVVLASVEAAPGGGLRIGYDEETLHLAAQAQSSLLVVNKRDAVDADVFARLLDQFKAEVARRVPDLAGHEIIPVSCKEAAQPTSSSPSSRAAQDTVDPGSIHTFIDRLAASFEGMTSLPPDMQDLLGVTERQRQLLERCRLWLEEYMVTALADDLSATEDPDIVLAAEHLRFAAECLAKITGRGDSGDVEDVLGVIFEK